MTDEQLAIVKDELSKLDEKELRWYAGKVMELMSEPATTGIVCNEFGYALLSPVFEKTSEAHGVPLIRVIKKEGQRREGWAFTDQNELDDYLNGRIDEDFLESRLP